MLTTQIYNTKQPLLTKETWNVYLKEFISYLILNILRNYGVHTCEGH